MESASRLRQAVRAIVVRPDESILLMQFEAPMWAGWIAPGGGIEPGEDLASALRRELREEIGLLDFEAGPPVWTRTVQFPIGSDFDGQADTFFMVRVDDFEPQPAFTEEELRAEGVIGLAWWSVADLHASTSEFSPRRLADLLPALLHDGAPHSPIDVGL